MTLWQFGVPQQSTAMNIMRKYIGFAAINPSDRPIEQLEIAEDMGFKGAGELHPNLQGFFKNEADWLALAGLAGLPYLG